MSAWLPSASPTSRRRAWAPWWRWDPPWARRNAPSPRPPEVPLGSTGYAARLVSTIPKTKRLPLIVLVATVVLFIAGYAIFRGLTHPSVPSGDVAVVQDAPSGLSPISQDEFNRVLLQTAASQSIKRIPAPGSAQYEQLKQGTMNNLLDAVWIQGEAAEMNITATPAEISSLLRQTIS